LIEEVYPMSRRLVAVLLIGALALAPSLGALESPSDPELEEGIRQTQIGDFEKAVVTLDSAARRLAAEGGRSADLARAYVYLSIAYLYLSQEQKAKAQFLEALRTDSDMQIDEGEFPPRVLEFFEEARQEAEAEGVVTPAPPPPAEAPAVSEPEPPVEPEPVTQTTAVPEEPEKKGGSAKWLLIGGGAAAAAGIALAAGGGSSGSSGSSGSTTLPPPQAVEEWVEKFSAQVPRRIPDLNQAFSQLNFGPAGTIVQAQLEFRIEHTCRGDLFMELRHPDGTTYTASGPADCADVWEGPIGVPAEGKLSNGIWTLTVMDTAAEDEGTLEVWGLRLLIRR
jgi:hypothetical protein